MSNQNYAGGRKCWGVTIYQGRTSISTSSGGFWQYRRRRRDRHQASRRTRSLTTDLRHHGRPRRMTSSREDHYQLDHQDIRQQEPRGPLSAGSPGHAPGGPTRTVIGRIASRTHEDYYPRGHRDLSQSRLRQQASSTSQTASRHGVTIKWFPAWGIIKI